jgi:hypothetical protein
MAASPLFLLGSILDKSEALVPLRCGTLAVLPCVLVLARAAKSG